MPTPFKHSRIALLHKVQGNFRIACMHNAPGCELRTSVLAIDAKAASQMLHDKGWRLSADGRPFCPTCVYTATH